MKICYLTNSAIPSTAASSIQIVKMCEAFSQLNNDVILITSNVSKKKIFSVITMSILNLYSKKLKSSTHFHWV